MRARAAAVAVVGMAGAMALGAQSFTPIRVNAGGSAYTDSGGNVWGADSGFSGGAQYNYGSVTVNGTADAALYRDVRWGTSFSYQWTVPNGAYTVKLRFAEVVYSYAGARKANIAINGTQVETNFDIFAAAGGMNLALDRTYPVTVSGGTVTVAFTATADVAIVGAVEVTAVCVRRTPVEVVGGAC